MSESTVVKEGRLSSEFSLARWCLLVGAVMVMGALAMLAFGKVDAESLGWADFLGLIKWAIGIGAGLCLGASGWYTGKRVDLKKTLGVGALLLAACLAMTAAPAMAGAVTTPGSSEPATMTSTPEPVQNTSTVASATSEAWNKVKSVLGLEQDGQALNAQQAQAVVSALAKLSQQNAQLKAQADAAEARQQVFSLSGGASQADTLIAALSQRVNQQAVLSSMARNAYGTGGNLAYSAVGPTQAGGQMTTADVRQAVKDELKANETWWDTAPWYIRVPIGIGMLAIFQDLGISLPGIN